MGQVRLNYIICEYREECHTGRHRPSAACITDERQNRTNCQTAEQLKLPKKKQQVTACLRVAQVICESLQFVSFEVVVISQHKVLHRTPCPLHFHNH